MLEAVKNYNIRGSLNYEGLWSKKYGLQEFIFDSVKWIRMKVNWCSGKVSAERKRVRLWNESEKSWVMIMFKWGKEP